ncbi:MAG: PAS domain-containing protein [Dehalococcoidia bacterium]|nr:PAS domain-containing protein [Dehalococcoidia bacterium]
MTSPSPYDAIDRDPVSSGNETDESPQSQADSHGLQITEAMAVNLSADGLMALDDQYRIRLFNPAMERLTGLKSQDVCGLVCSDVLHLKDGHDASLCDTICPLAGKHTGSYDVEGIIVRPDKKKVDVDLNFSVLCSEDGGLEAAIVNVRDAGSLRQADHIHSTLLASVSHELQTPISIIKAYANTLARADAKWSEDTIRDKLLAIEEESDRLSRLVSRLMFTSRLSAGAVSLNLMLIDLPKQARRVATRLAEVDKSHEISVRFPDDFPPIMGDPETLDEVLTNLIENALKFSPERGTVTVGGWTSETDVYVTVGDHGIGIAEGNQEKVFERFYRASESSTGAFPGTGLGLYICRNLVHAHGGEIWVASKQGAGSRFTFSLPRTTDG